MNKLENIGFYTLSDYRASQVSLTSPLWRCELILTDKCNFACPYCRGIASPYKGSISYEKASFIIKMWGIQGLKNIRFSGGEPTLWRDGSRTLVDLVLLAKEAGIGRIAISTNGSMPTSFYQELVAAGVNDFSISLDSCCATTGDKMAGNKPGVWNTIIHNIQELSKTTYVTVGIVFTPENISEFEDLVVFADSLGVADIRIIPSAQWNRKFQQITLNPEIVQKHPILRYRIEHIYNKQHVRGLTDIDNHQCPLMLDDMAVLGDYHFPCIIFMREQGPPVGKIDFSLSPKEAIENIRQERLDWIRKNNICHNEICKNNCLDVCKDYNNKVRFLQPLTLS